MGTAGRPLGLGVKRKLMTRYVIVPTARTTSRYLEARILFRANIRNRKTAMKDRRNSLNRLFSFHVSTKQLDAF